jgi:hypothetical protein
MTTPLSQDFQQVFGNFNAVNMPPESGRTAHSSILPSNPITSWPTLDWSGYRPFTDQVPYKPVVTLSPEQKQKVEAQLQKAVEASKKHNTAVKYDSGKANWSLMPWEAVEEINKVLEFGAHKYAAHNWQQGEGFRYTRVLNSLLRHVFAYMRGEDLDPESGLSHMAHAGCNVLFILYYIKNKSRYKNDDRYVQ